MALEEGDAKLLADLTENDAANPNLAANIASGSEQAPSSARAAEAAANVKQSTLRSKLRLATVDNFQGKVVQKSHIPGACMSFRV